jgi:PPK2 family polyphosphate:nucleotide phosphotransferase
MTSMRELLRVPGGDTFDLASVDPGSTPGLPAGKRRKWARRQLADLGDRLAAHQETLYARAKGAADPRRVLLVLQAMDCGGKDGTVRAVVGLLNPQGVQIVGFGPPTAEEQRHDFLWRIRRGLPRPGYVGVFNRSHYEDVLVARVHGLVPDDVWGRRYDLINEFERGLVADQVTVVKVMLHISYAEQRKRLRARLADPTKYWKYNPDDVAERVRWPAYQAAYADALGRCSTDAAPWFVVPADHKWYRNWAVARILDETLAGLDLGYPPAEFDVAAERARVAAT